MSVSALPWGLWKRAIADVGVRDVHPVAAVTVDVMEGKLSRLPVGDAFWVSGQLSPGAEPPVSRERPRILAPPDGPSKMDVWRSAYGWEQRFERQLWRVTYQCGHVLHVKTRRDAPERHGCGCIIDRQTASLKGEWIPNDDQEVA